MPTSYDAKVDAASAPDVTSPSFASIGAGAGLGLPVIGALLGHAQAATTHRYAHLASDPLQQAADLIGDKLAAAMNVDKRMSPDEAVELGESA